MDAIESMVQLLSVMERPKRAYNRVIVPLSVSLVAMKLRELEKFVVVVFRRKVIGIM